MRAAPAELTFDALADLYIERYAKRQKASWKNDEGYLRANARPAWGQRNAASITSQDAARLLFEVVAVAPISANRLRSVLVKLFGWACESALLSVNPMQGVKKPHREGKGKTRTLNDQEIRVLWQALEKAEAAPGILAALKCLLLLGQRPGEVAGMAVSELHHLNNDRTAHWELPPGRMKARRAHVVPLPALAREIVTCRDCAAADRQTRDQAGICLRLQIRGARAAGATQPVASVGPHHRGARRCRRRRRDGGKPQGRSADAA